RGVARVRRGQRMQPNEGLLARPPSHSAHSPTVLAPATMPSQAGFRALVHSHIAAWPTHFAPATIPSNAGLSPLSQIHTAAVLIADATVSTTVRKPSKFLYA